MTNSDAVIYLADARVCVQNDKYRSYQTLKEPFHNLIAFNDETLGPGASIKHEGPGLIVPLVGDVVTSERLSPGQTQIVHDVNISNPYKEELVNYLYIGLRSTSNFTVNNNSLTPLTPSFHIGKFDGRTDGIYKLSSNASGLFVFAIEGAFEAQNRLLHPRDGLALWNLTEMEFEALSNEAILLVIEC